MFVNLTCPSKPIVLIIAMLIKEYLMILGY